MEIAFCILSGFSSRKVHGALCFCLRCRKNKDVIPTYTIRKSRKTKRLITLRAHQSAEVQGNGITAIQRGIRPSKEIQDT